MFFNDQFNTRKVNMGNYSLTSKDDFLKKYNISLCCGADLIQYINIIPKINIERFDMYGN